MNKLMLLSVILVEGFVSIATEIITIRQLSTVAGSSVIVTSFVIGIFLLALAYGYKRGGAYCRDFTNVLQRNFVIASALLGVGLSSIFILLFFGLVEAYITRNSLYILIAYLIVVISPLAYVLGQTIPITMNLFKQETASVIGSKVLHLSTLGSFLGSVLTTMLFMNYVGVAWTVLTNSFLLIACAAIIAPIDYKSLRSLVTVLLALPAIYLLNINQHTGNSVYNNAYSNYRVIDPYTLQDGRVGKILAINNSASSFVEYGTNSGLAYVEKIKNIIFNDLKIRNKNVLVLGAGGFSISAAGDYDNHFTYIDIDPDIETVVRKKFLPDIKGKFINADARVYLRNNKQKYPVIISDTYGSKTSIPAHLLTEEYLILLHKNLEDDGGVAILNVIMNPTMQCVYSKTIDNTIRKVFANCVATPVTYTNAMNNVLYVCHKHDNLDANHIYTDNHNRAALDYAMLTD